MNLEICDAVLHEAGSGVKYYDLEQGKGPVAELGETVSVS